MIWEWYTVVKVDDATPKRWRFVRGHCGIYFPGGIIVNTCINTEWWCRMGKISPKEYRSQARHDWSDVLQSGGVSKGDRCQFTQHRVSSRRLGDKCREQLGEPSEELFWSPLSQRTAGNWEINVEWGEPGTKTTCTKEPKRQTCQFAPGCLGGKKSLPGMCSFCSDDMGLIINTCESWMMIQNNNDNW